MRKAEINRKTYETDITLALNIDGSGNTEIDTGIGFLDHMLTNFAKHGKFDLSIRCKGDTCVDDHHTVEDIGIALGQAFAKCLEDKTGIRRYSTSFTPMDESLVQISLDVSGRPYLVFNVTFLTEKTGNFDAELAEEFFRAFVNHAKLTLHINMMYGKNTHHIIEAIFKGAGRTLREGLEIQGDMLLSTKGMID